MIEEAAACMVPVLFWLFLLGIGPFVINHVFPRISVIQRWIDSLPDCEQEEDYHK